MRNSLTGIRGWRTIARAEFCALVLISLCTPASAQGWWPFGGSDEPPTPREPVYRQQQPPPAANPPPAVAPPPAATNWATKNPICLQLEQRLVQEGQKGQSRDQLPRIESEIRQVDRTYNVGSAQLDKSCYEYFLFTKTFRATPQCKDLARDVDTSKRRLAELEAQRQDIMGSSGRSYQDDIIRELARNNCGANYVDQARRRDGGMWQDEEAIGNNTWTPQGGTGVATYRTICVRLCDGYYFPVSFSTLPSHFPQDAEACQSKCAAPSELYYHPNPGGTVEQAVALKSQEPYTHLKSAFRYRKEYVNGCSCKEAEYVPANASAEKKADGTSVGTPGAPVRQGPPRRAEGTTDGANAPEPIITGSTNAAAAPEPVARPAPANPPDAKGWEPQ